MPDSRIVTGARVVAPVSGGFVETGSNITT